MFPQRSSRWFGPAWPTGPDRPQSAAALLGSRRRLLLARGRLRRFCGWGKAGLTQRKSVSAFGLVRRVFTWETWPTYHQASWKAKPKRATCLHVLCRLKPTQTFHDFYSSRSRRLTDTELIKQCIDECTARIEIGLHYQIPYPRPIHLPPMGLTPLRGRGLRSQEKLRKLSKPVYLKSHDEIS
ncbi:LYR motif-containing protein 1 isoform X3 [Suricata suricatta]|uniref:LYR motif-containing protein 1 isoform X3 n=1 Tax=Suricata suricatta TaxID=37032 RepID=UPI0011559BF9|nr:LYR motif-containing protein 1 isoform X3 [Suricata suricatta]